MKENLTALLVLLSLVVNAQQKLTLEDCYALANKNYPIAKQAELLQQKNTYEIDALKKGNVQKAKSRNV